MQLMRFRVYLAATTDPTDLAATGTHDLAILPADRMRAERLSTNELAPSQRGPGSTRAYPESWVMLWLWCAAWRHGVITTGTTFPEFCGRVLDYDRLDADGQLVPDDADPELVEDPELDPTQPGAATSLP